MTEEEFERRKHPSLGSFPGANSVSTVGQKVPGVNLLRPTAMEAVKRVPTMAVRKGGIFRHPNDWTEEEDAVIVELMRAKVPLYVIAAKVNCERHTLAKHIEETPELKQLKADMEEARLDSAEYEADRLVTSGNPTMIMFYLDRKGKKRGWSQDESGDSGQDSESRIVMGKIPDEDIEAARDFVKSITGVNPGEMLSMDDSKVFEDDPMKQAANEERAAEEMAAEREAEAALPKEAEGSSTSPLAEEEPVGGDLPVSSAPHPLSEAESIFADGGFSPFGEV